MSMTFQPAFFRSLFLRQGRRSCHDSFPLRTAVGDETIACREVIFLDSDTERLVYRSKLADDGIVVLHGSHEHSVISLDALGP